MKHKHLFTFGLVMLVVGARTVPQVVKQISSPHNSMLVIGRVLVYNDNDF